MTTLNLSDITFGERISREYGNYTGIEELADSIKDRGLIQPIVINRLGGGTPESDPVYSLAAGGRRFKALELLGITTLTEGISSVPGAAGFVLAIDLPSDQLLEVELEENLFRVDMDWRDRSIMVFKIHNLKTLSAVGTDLKWGQRQTGELLGCSLGDVNNCIAVAKAIRSGNEAVKACGSIREALQVMLKQKTDEAQRRLVQSSVPSPSSDSTGLVPDLSAFFGSEDSPASAKPAFESESLVQGVNETGVKKTVVRLHQQLVHGDCLQVLAKIKPESFDHIVSDPPYGIDMENLDLTDQSRIKDTHDVKENLTLLEALVPECFRVLKNNAFCVLFCDIDHFQTIAGWGRKAGFKVQRWPLVWHKEHTCRNQSATFNFTKNYEIAIVMRKGVATLQRPQGTSVLACDGSIERKLYNNPFAKPFELWKFVLEAVASKGQSILDPCMGEGSCLRACVNLGMQPWGVEKEEHHYNNAIEHLKATYTTLLQDGVEFK